MLGTAGAAPIIFPVAEIRARVVVADDDVLLREGLASLLTGSGFDVVGRSGDPSELLALSSGSTDRIW
jgi:DNA-binding NarL/FixJ family response regulator